VTDDKTLLTARAICAEQADKQDETLGDRYRSGEWDHTVWMRLVIKALEVGGAGDE
jgi:hypothetical protein